MSDYHDQQQPFHKHLFTRRQALSTDAQQQSRCLPTVINCLSQLSHVVNYCGNISAEKFCKKILITDTVAAGVT